MSAAGAIMDALGAVAVAAVAELVAANVERGVRPLAEVPQDAFPHVFLTSFGEAPLQAVELLEERQRRITTTVVVQFYTRGTQEEALVDGDAIAAGVAADPTLGGLVRFADVLEVALFEHRSEPHRAILVVVSAVEEA